MYIVDEMGDTKRLKKKTKTKSKSRIKSFYLLQQFWWHLFHNILISFFFTNWYTLSFSYNSSTLHLESLKLNYQPDKLH